MYIQNVCVYIRKPIDLSDSQRYLWLPQGSKNSDIDKVTDAGVISKGFVEEVWFENWAL